MKNIISTCVFLFVLSVFGLASCKFGVNNHKEATNYDTTQIDYEMSKLTKVNGWWAFSWPSFKIIDLYDCNISERSTGKWETYIPVHHIMNWNIVKK